MKPYWNIPLFDFLSDLALREPDELDVEDRGRDGLEGQNEDGGREGGQQRVRHKVRVNFLQ